LRLRVIRIATVGRIRRLVAANCHGDLTSASRRTLSWSTAPVAARGPNRRRAFARNALRDRGCVAVSGVQPP